MNLLAKIFKPKPKYGMGLIFDKPDHRDYTLQHPKVTPLPRVEAPVSKDLRQWDTPIMNQGNLGSCTANAVCGMVQFFQNHAFGKYVPLSRLYLYKATRYLEGTATGDTGATLRDTMQALVLHGVPPETYWNYNINKFDEDPTWLDRPNSTWFIAGMADNYAGTKYIRLDPENTTPDTLLSNIKLCINSYMPVVFGTLVWESIFYVNTQGDIPMPPDKDSRPTGAHALTIVGYDDNRGCLGTDRKGALLLRNSWGKEWGDKGYGWLPYDYLYRNYACDFWTLQNARWVNLGDFA